ncbi:sugar ABC transporter substrate-binding protein [Synechococcus sp. CS-602]|nr:MULTISPECIES: sugar ABC transporter substrate-binding protein [Synechococcaceae]MCT4364472.1 sugar ABC transporter substrate-binding protein [Candidatus Regnicoccus frigidus MAG-AL1]APD48052.1 ABC transporter substrate-binding protein [Synechococcus sp. SynAce01]MCT0203060.1 sugar ABC transporter substrate-binding protein [Synechococcus sp. CS-603]MCT0204696.1 sugar ABC transporter substrate-binding protein [Synechococcus sp. CS-602]MCT0246118.1 sugar ABC transporter substrate-binding prote
MSGGIRWSRRAVLGSALLLAAGCAPRRRPGRELEFWSLELSPKFDTYITSVIAAWEALHPGIKVRWTDLPWGSVERKLLAAVFARTAPDVVNLNPLFAANLASKGGLLALDPLLPPGAGDTFLPRIWQAGRIEGEQIGIPWYLTARITLANNDLLRRAGYSAPPRRWQEVPAFAEAVKRRTGRYALFVTAVPDDSAELLESLVQMGVTLQDQRRRAAFNSPAGRRAFAFWTDLYRRGLLPREVVSQGYRRAVELYQSGELATLASGAEFLRSIQTNAPQIAAETEPHPPLTGPKDRANVAMMNLAVPRQSAFPEEALSFALFLTNATNQARFAEEARVLPSASGALAKIEQGLRQPALGDAQEELVRRARLQSLETLEMAEVLVPASPGVKRLQAILYRQLQRAMLGQSSSDEALAAAEREWNSYAVGRWP